MAEVGTVGKCDTDMLIEAIQVFMPAFQISSYPAKSLRIFSSLERQVTSG